MCEDWNTITNAQKNKDKKKIKEITYFLSELLSNGACMRCMNKSCKITEQHGIFYPDKITTFVLNPSYINGVQKCIDDEKLDFNGKKPFYTTCNYAFGKCRNCEEGRFKYITINEQQVAICFPIIDSVRFKITIGVHIDIKLVMKGRHFDASLLPIDISLKNEEYEENKENENSSLNDNWPSLLSLNNDKKIEKPKIIMDFNKITKLNSQETINMDQSKIIMDFNKITKLNSQEDETLNVLSDSVNLTLESDEYWKKDTYINEIANFTINTETEYLLFKSYVKILDENDYLRNENSYLKNDIIKYKEEINNIKDINHREKFIIKNNKVYDEILNNIKYINNRVTDQFVDTNYSEYILL